MILVAVMQGVETECPHAYTPAQHGKPLREREAAPRQSRGHNTRIAISGLLMRRIKSSAFMSFASRQSLAHLGMFCCASPRCCRALVFAHPLHHDDFP